MFLALISCGSDKAVILNGQTVCTYDPSSDDAGCLEMLQQVLVSLANIHNIGFSEHTTEAPCEDWTWDDIITALELEQSSDTMVPILLNELDDEGLVVDSSTMLVSEQQISDIVDHAAQLVIVSRAQASDEVTQRVFAELEEALVVANVIAEE